MLRRDARRPAWAGVATLVVLFAAWYGLTSLTHTISPGRFPSPVESWDALRQITLTGYADARLTPRGGMSADSIVKTLVADDAGRDHRQVHMIDVGGRIAAHTGSACIDWNGHLAGDTFSVAGNMLAGAQVLEATAAANVAKATMPFPRRLIAAMRAGEAAGGDKRGKQSAALLIYGEDEWSDLDLRVDDHLEPLVELERLEGVSRERWAIFRRFLPSRRDPVGVTDRTVIEQEIARELAAGDGR